ncbi:MAG: aminotransferase class I/II-fold pyridoxal phosphate-dependent enzyme [Chitinophagaceae bacterium]
MSYSDSFLDKKLAERISGNFLRSLTIKKGLVDFCSNDYLGISIRQLLYEENRSQFNHGASGSRSLSGNSALAEDTESKIASFHEAEAALIFNSGYNANTGLLSSVPQRGDMIFYDALSHASIRDGIRLSLAQSFSFEHNNMQHLEEKLREFPQTVMRNIFVVTETVFSMDGDLAPVADLVNLCEKYSAHLIIDEAHALGVLGDKGEGLVQHLNLHKRVFARIYTYGKGPGCHGASVAGSHKLKSYLINFARSFIFTTALPEIAISAIAKSYSIFPEMKSEREKLKTLISFFQMQDLPFQKLNSTTPVQGVIIPGNDEVKNIAANLELNGFDIRPILYPSVPKGKERLRISMHAFNTEDQILRMTDILTNKK